jgi:pimeloyl-ACP methyl ester carboxylesterase
VIDIGHGAPIVLVPGIQGRWEWMEPTVTALARHYRVVAYSLADEATSGFAWRAEDGFENYVRQLAEVLDRANLAAATLIGVSYGGMIAAEFAARFPERVTRLVMASALPPDWMPDARARFYLRAPRLLSPVFVATSPLRLQPEMRAAFPALGARLRFMASHGLRMARAPMSPVRMARRVRWVEQHRFAPASAVTAPTLVVTGEERLDRVVPVAVSRRMVTLVQQARHVVLSGTGHIGIVTRPDDFCALMDTFLERPAC